MATLGSETIEAPDVCRFELVHAVDEIELRGGKRQMEVIAHEQIGMNPPGLAFADLAEGEQKRLRGARTFEKVAMAMAAVDHMVYRAGELQPLSPRHASNTNQYPNRASKNQQLSA